MNSKNSIQTHIHEEVISENYHHERKHSSIAIKVENLTKIYPLYNNPIERLKEALHPLRKKYHRDFFALNDISFEIKKGDTVGIIGQNGSGKSTLLKIISGVLAPTSGSVFVDGNISSLLELGTGFNPDLSGLENIYFYGTINGYSKSEMDTKLDNILSFADIGDFIYQPVKTYSSGMFVRLAFACAVQIDPEVLIVDEALAVGDIFFQAKCMARMKRMIDSGVTVLFVSHSTDQIIGLCNNAILLNQGRIQAEGGVKKIVEIYRNEFLGEINKNQGREYQEIQTSVDAKDRNEDKSSNLIENENSDLITNLKNNKSLEHSGSGEALITTVSIVNQSDTDINHIMHYNEKIKIKIQIEVYKDIKNLGIGVYLFTENGLMLYAGGCGEINNPEFYKLNFKKGQKINISVETSFPVMHGNYSLSMCIQSYEDNKSHLDNYYVDWVDNAYVFKMEKREPYQMYQLIEFEHNLEYRVLD